MLTTRPAMTRAIRSTTSGVRNRHAPSPECFRPCNGGAGGVRRSRPGELSRSASTMWHDDTARWGRRVANDSSLVSSRLSLRAASPGRPLAAPAAGAEAPRRRSRRRASRSCACSGARPSRRRCSRPPSSPRCRRRRSATIAAACRPIWRGPRGWPGSSRARATAGTMHVEFERAMVHMQHRRRAAGAAPDHRPARHRRRRDGRQPGRGARRDPRACPARPRSRSRGSATARRRCSPRIEPDAAAGDRLGVQIVHPRRAEPPGAGRPAALERRRPARPPLDPVAARSSDWPRGAPVTLHTLAALMISQSDNTATDMLLHPLGRENVERMMAAIGVAAPARNRPLLSTLELSAIKTAPDAGAQRLAAGRRGRRAGACSPRLCSRRIASPASTSRASPATRSRIDTSNGSPRPPIWCGRWTGCAATATTARRRSWRSTPALGAPLRGELRLCRLQGRLGARRAQPDLAGPQPRRRLACRHRQLEQSGRAVDEAALRRADVAGDAAVR